MFLKNMVTSMENTENSKRKLDKKILDNFTNLVKPQESTRIKSSINLVRYLCESDSENLNELNYALGRIIRGLGSSNPTARTGFYTLLVALINSIEIIDLDQIFPAIEKQLHRAASNAKSENADVATGQILACGAVIRSRLWSSASLEQKENVFSLIIKASKERTYLKLLAYQFIIVSFEYLKEKQFQKIFSPIEDVICKQWNEQNIDTLYLLYAIKKQYPSFVGENFLLKNVGTRQLICEESLEQVCEILLTIPRLESLKHPFYKTISTDILANNLLEEFTRYLDAQMMNRNRNKLLAGVKIYSYILESITDTSQVPLVLSTNFVQHTLNYFRNVKHDPDFQKIIHEFFTVLVSTLKKDGVQSNTKISVLKKLLFFPGTFIFEKVTKTKVIQYITASLDIEGVKNLATLFRGVVAGSEKIDSQDEHWLNNDRLYAAHLLVKMLNLPVVKEENDWKVEQLCFLIDLGLFKMDEGVNVGSELASSLKSTFFGSLDLKLIKLDELVYILTKVFNHIDSKINSENLETMVRGSFTPEAYETWQKTAHKISKIEKKRKKHNIIKTTFLTLFLQMGIQLFNDVKLATESLDELFTCYEKSKKSRKSNDSQDELEAEQNQTDNDPLWVEVVTDLFLNLLSHNSHLLRHLVNCVFPHLCEYMTPVAIHQILTVLDPKNDNPLSKNISNDSEDEESVSGEESDNENEEDNENEDDNDDESHSEESESEENETVNDKMRMALHEVLRKNSGYETDEESVDLDNLGETEGKELDKALAAVFQQYKPNHGKQKKQNKDDEALTHFRIRVLDLIEIYINSTPSMLLSLEIMLPLLQAVEFSIRESHQLPLHNRLKACLKKLTALKKFSNTEGVNETVLCDILKSLLEKGTKTTWIMQDMRLEIAQSCTYIIRCSDILSQSVEQTPKKSKKKLNNTLIEMILTELENYFHKRDSLTPIVLFKNILNLSWSGCLKLIPPLLQYLFEDDVKPFRKSQATELLKIFYQNRRYLTANIEETSRYLSNYHEIFSENILNFFTRLNSSPDKNVKEKFVCNLFNLLTAIKTSCLETDNINWDQMGTILREYRSSVSFSKDAKTAFNKLCNKLGISNVVKPKQRAPEAKLATPKNDEVVKESADKKNKVKKTKNKEKLKLKKEAKQMRLQSLSEGLNDLNFTEANCVNDDETDAVDVHQSDNENETVDSDNTTLGKKQRNKKRRIDQSSIQGSNNIEIKSKKVKK